MPNDFVDTSLIGVDGGRHVAWERFLVDVGDRQRLRGVFYTKTEVSLAWYFYAAGFEEGSSR